MAGAARYSDADIALLQRIQELTNDGLNLAGVKRVLDLEARVDQLEAELDRRDTAASAAVDQVHRQYRRDLVPVPPRSITLYKAQPPALTASG